MAVAMTFESSCMTVTRRRVSMMLFKNHVNVGFFRGAEVSDPDGILEGTGKFMRHVKLRPEREVDAAALTNLIEAAYTDMKRRREAEASVRNH